MSAICRVAVLGTGAISASWAALGLAPGGSPIRLLVRATPADPAASIRRSAGRW